MKVVSSHPIRQKVNTGTRKRCGFMPHALRATISLSPDMRRKVSSTAIITDMGVMKARKKGME